jgi:high-affinity iron transporter
MRPGAVSVTMQRVSMSVFLAATAVTGLSVCAMGGDLSDGAVVVGMVRMPEVCSPAVSPAVVFLTAAGRDGKPAVRARLAERNAADRSGVTNVVLVNQRGLQFTPRVQAIALGQTVRFTNDDRETHNVHIVSPGFAFNQSMGPGQYQDFTPDHAGVMRLACDIHLHMRGFVVISPTKWVKVCDQEGRFRLDGVADGRYVLTAWHEMGDPIRKEITVAGETRLEMPALVLPGPSGSALASGRSQASLVPVRPWSDVVDRIATTLSVSRDAATRPGGLARARTLAEDAYFLEFEASDMETAVQQFLGFARKGELERQFYAIRSAVRDVAEKRQPASALEDSCHRLLLDLVEATVALNAKGVTDRSRIDAGAKPAVATADISTSGPLDDPRPLLEALRRGFHRVEEAAAHDGPGDAASELSTVYMTEFEPLERYFDGRSPQDVRPLEIQFNTLRGELGAGLSGEKLTARLNGLSAEIESVVARLEARPAGTFGAAFFSSLVTIVREGLEVILILTMLLALVAKASDASGTRTGATGGHSAVRGEPAGAGAAADNAMQAKGRAVQAIWWGVALAVAASLVTALALNRLVHTARGAARETLEGVVMLAASAVLFYVSFWLISNVQAKRWMDFLKQQARRGLELGGQGTLALTAFLAVYREGAETALMYQALLGSEGQSPSGFIGLIAGVLLGLALLAVVAVLIRATSVRLPLHTFFKFSGAFLFALAIVFAGNGVFELQNAGVLITTNVSWMGRGLPWAGLYPSVQVISVQGLLLAGAVLAWVIIPRVSDGASAARSAGVSLAARRG